MLAPLAGARADAALLLAAILQEQGRWEESLARFAAAARVLRATPASAQTAAALVQAIDGMAFNERELGDFRGDNSPMKRQSRNCPRPPRTFISNLVAIINLAADR